ncbi:MAG: response regulator [Verrucomicrobia bacterium]|nr:response regulator [Verrucomicrobiota bacterium]
MKILIAEDDPIGQKIARVTIEKLGHEVVTANDGQEAWNLLLQHTVHVIVSDWMMPNLDGLDLCTRVRARPGRHYVYFILLTARTGKADYFKAMETGVDDFLAKPLIREELLIRLRVAERILKFMGQVRDLKRLLPICSYCKKIRDDKDYWHGIENYIHAQTGADFSHGICPDCRDKVMGSEISGVSNEADEDR